MFKYIRKNQKKVLAIFSVGLMVAFALPTATQQFSRGREVAVGTFGPGKTELTARDLGTYRSQWAVLRQTFGLAPLCIALGAAGPDNEELIITALTNPQLSEMASQIFNLRQTNPMLLQMLMQQRPEVGALASALLSGEMGIAQMENNDEMFLLLAKEADSLGISASRDLVDTILKQRGTSREENEALAQALTTFLRIHNAADRAASTFKVSQPALEHLRSSRMQQISLQLVEFTAKEFLDKVPAPTDQQLQEQFNKYKDVEKDKSDSGFGYRYPNRVKFDAVIIDRAEIKKAIAPVQLDEIWEYFLRNQNSPEFILTTQPATKPSDAFSLNPNDKPAPTTRPKTFQEAREQVLTRLTEQRITELTDKVRDAVRSTLKGDFDAYQEAASANKPAPKSSLGMPYNSFDYLKALRDKIQKDLKVTLTIEDKGDWQAEKSLRDTELGKMNYSTQNTSVPLSAYLTARVDKFLTDEQKRASRADLKLNLWEPSPAFVNEMNNKVAIARATAADPAHVPVSLDEVRKQVVEDVKTSMAYQKAKDAAQAALDAARGGKLLETVAAGIKKKVITTGLFGPNMPPAGYDVKAIDKFDKAAFALLTAPPRSGSATRPASTQASSRPSTAPVVALKDHPVGLIELAAEGKVLVAEMAELKPVWSRDRQPMVDAAVLNQERQGVEMQMRQAWYNYENVVDRTGFVPAEKRTPRKGDQQPKPAAPPVDNPFTGTIVP